jgi:uncharacterized protein YegL
MAGQPAAKVNEALREMIAEMELLSQGTKPYFRISVVSFGSNVATLVEWAAESDVDIDQIAWFTGDGGTTNTREALAEAIKVLERHPGRETDFRPYVFFFSDGHPDDAGGAVAMAEKLKEMRIAAGAPRIVTIGLGNADETFMRAIASNPDLFVHLADPSQLVRLFPSIGTIVGSAGGEAAIDAAILNL